MSAEDICKWPSGHFIDRGLLLDWGAPYMVARPPISWRPMVGNKALYRRHPNTDQQRKIKVQCYISSGAQYYSSRSRLGVLYKRKSCMDRLTFSNTFYLWFQIWEVNISRKTQKVNISLYTQADFEVFWIPSQILFSVASGSSVFLGRILCSLISPDSCFLLQMIITWQDEN